MILNEKGILRQSDLVVYPIKLVVVIGDMEEEVNKYYMPRDKHYNWIGAPKEGVGAAVSLVEKKKDGKYGLMVWFSMFNDCTGSNLCHECGHLSLEIFRYIGAKINYEDQEPFCYLLGTIFRLCNDAFYHWKDFIEKSKTTKKK